MGLPPAKSNREHANRKTPGCRWANYTVLPVRTVACTPGEVVMAAAGLIATRANSVARSTNGMAPVTHCDSGPLPWQDRLDSIAPASNLQAGKHDALVADASAAAGVLLAHSKSSRLCRKGGCACVGRVWRWPLPLRNTQSDLMLLDHVAATSRGAASLDLA